MKIHEYQAKDILRRYGVAVPRGIACFDVAQAVEAGSELGASGCVVKAQIHAGGRGKGGGVKVARSALELRQRASEILGMRLITHQTGPEGRIVKRLLIEEAIEIREELYASLVVDRRSQCVVLMASSEGGMDIEEVAAKTPGRIHKSYVDPLAGLGAEQAAEVARKIHVPGALTQQAVALLQGLYKAFDETDASLVEINPLAVTGDGRVLALDAKMTFDDNALFRHPDILALRDFDEEDEVEIEASKFGLSYISLDGNIGCLVNGAGLAMATMDIIKLSGGSPANFLDVGGGASEEQVQNAFRILLSDPNVRAVFVNIFGGILRCDVLASGVVSAAKALKLKLPVVIRMEGTNVEQGKEILRNSGFNFTVADGMKDGAEKVVKLAGGAR